MNWLTGIRNLVVLIMVGTFIPTEAQAQLPAMTKGGWAGYFAGFNNSRFDFGLDSTGRGSLRPIDDRKRPIRGKLAIPIVVSVEETMTDGRVIQRQVAKGSLTSADEPTEKLEKTSFRGKATGGAEFEIFVEQGRNSILYGGRLITLDKGARNPMRLVISANIPTVYEAEDRTDKAFLRSIRNDAVRVVWTDGSRHRAGTAELIEKLQEKLVGPGISRIDVLMDGYRDRSFGFFAHGESKLGLYQRVPTPLNNGFSVQWSPDQAKDPEGAARFEIKVN